MPDDWEERILWWHHTPPPGPSVADAALETEFGFVTTVDYSNLRLSIVTVGSQFAPPSENRMV